jgi:hypothetical protein
MYWDNSILGSEQTLSLKEDHFLTFNIPSLKEGDSYIMYDSSANALKGCDA